MMGSAVPKPNTIYDIEALPEGERAELIDGVIYDMASPTATHQRLVLRMARSISDYIDARGGSCETFIAPFAVYLNDDEYDFFEPDVCVICDPSKVDEKGCHGAPDWVIEVVSESTRSRDYMTKLNKYTAAGVREYWIVDPLDGTVTVYDFEGDALGKYKFSDDIVSHVVQGCTISLSRMR